MNSVLAGVIDQHCPKFNTNVTNGSAKEILKVVPEFLDDIFSSSIKSLSPTVDLKYQGFRRLTPREEFGKLVANETNKVTYDIAISDIYMVEYVFSYQGETIKRQLYLPYADTGNIIKISNTAYSIVPVLSDTVVSPSFNEVFVRLLKDKLSFRSLTRNFVFNNERIPAQVIHTKIVKTGSMELTDNIGRPVTPVSLYLLGEYGLYKTMSMYFKTNEIKILTGNVDELRDTYNIYESTKIRPRNLKDNGYIGHDLKICVHKSVKITTFLDNFVYGIIYVFDILPEHTNDLLYILNNDSASKHDDEILYWRILLGRIAYTNTYSVDRIVDDMTEHFNMLQGYMDNLIRKKLRENNIRVTTFFDLLAVILDNYNVWLLNSKEYNSDTNNRYIDILYYILYDIIVGFNKVILNINKRASKKAIIRLKEINKLFFIELSPKKIFGLVKSKSQSLALQLCDVTSDIRYTKMTAMLEDRLVFRSYAKYNFLVFN